MKEKRKATRVQYRCRGILSLENGISINGQIHDLSLRGAYLTGGDPPLFQIGDRCGFQIRLSGGDDNIMVTGSAKIIRKCAEQSLAICFLDVEAQGLEQLRRIIKLNFNDDAKIDKELEALMEKAGVQEQQKK